LNSETKIKEIVRWNPDLILLQEIWDPKENIIELLPGEKAMKIRDDKYGGSLISLNEKFLKYTEQHSINNDSLLVKANLAGNRNVWICTLYLPRKKKKDLLYALATIKEIVPEHEWSRLLIG